MLVSTILFVFIYVKELTSINVTTIRPNMIVSSDIETTSCGVDRLPNNTVQEGIAAIESYPWLGLLIYPIDKDTPTTTTVILIATKIALAAALDIDFYPKKEFRARSRVILGNNCTGPFIRIRDYTFHPEFNRNTFSSIAIIQLDTEELGIDCYNSSMVMVYKMDYVDPTHCRDYYRRIELDTKGMWPTHIACAQGLRGGHCIWRSGTALVIRHDGQWKLLGFGIYGPGCQSPSRFLDYGMYHLWVTRVMARIGQPTVTKIAPNQIVIRKTTKNIQRYGPCDPEEANFEIYSKRTTIVPPYDEYSEYSQIETIYYNLTLQENVNYYCIILKVWNTLNVPGTPIINIRRLCTYPKPLCTKSDMLTVYYYLQISFRHTCIFKVISYGASIKYDVIENKMSEY